MSGAKVWFISDPHFDHANFVRGGRIGTRGQFGSVTEMNEFILDSLHRHVLPHHKLYVLGDVTLQRRDEGQMARFVRRLPGHTRLIPGNHDHFTWEQYQRAGFEKVLVMRVMANILFTHIPVHPNQFARFTGNVHGHLHNRVVLTEAKHPDRRYVNVCVEATNYRPVSLDEIVTYFNRQEELRHVNRIDE